MKTIMIEMNDKTSDLRDKLSKETGLRKAVIDNRAYVEGLKAVADKHGVKK